MPIDIDALVDAVASGDTDRVDEAIQQATAPEPADRFGWYDELLAAGRPVFDSADGDVRRSVVRLLREAYPGLELPLARSDPSVRENIRLADTAAQRQAYVDLLIDALDDDDRRVREAAVQGVDPLARAMAAADLADEQEALHDVLSELAVRQPEEKRKHTERALRMVGRPAPQDVLAEVERHLEEQ